MKHVLLFLLLTTSSGITYAQHNIFMEILENKKICNKEDELTYFLQANSFERQNEDHYYHHYALNGEFYTTCIINQNECYVIYRTNNAKDYNRIKATVTGTCHKEYAADRSVSYVCNTNRIQDAQVFFSGYSQAEKMYEIMVYQNPDNHEVPYAQSDRIAPEEEKVVSAVPKIKKAKRIVTKKATSTSTTTTTTTTATKQAAKPAPAAVKKEIVKEIVKETKQQVTNKKPSVISTKSTVPSVIK
ncbi:MAG: hypothetical protein K9G49_05875 [Taibaiella sp.]|nr:hypothetical protein [Taibaiella sp.]